MKLSLALACTAFLGTACSSSSSPVGSSSGSDGGGETGVMSEGGGTSETGIGEAGGDSGLLADAGDSSDAAVVCNTLVNSASPVTVAQVAQNPPALVGGTVVDGTYFLTDLTTYTGPGGPTGSSGTSQVTIQISAGTVQVITNGMPATRTEMLTTTGNHFTSTDTCPDTTAIQGTYTATSTSLVVQFPGGTDDAGARTVQETLTKQ